MMFISALPFAARRLWAHRSLAASLVLGLVIAVALAVGVPLYADGVNFSMLNRALSQAAEQSRRAPFNFVFRYIGSWHGAIETAQYQPVNDYLSNQVNGIIGLPRETLTRYIATDSLQLYPEMERINRARRLDVVRLAYQSELYDHIELIEGALPQAVPNSFAEWAVAAGYEVVVTHPKGYELAPEFHTADLLLLFPERQLQRAAR